MMIMIVIPYSLVKFKKIRIRRKYKYKSVVMDASSVRIWILSLDFYIIIIIIIIIINNNNNTVHGFSYICIQNVAKNKIVVLVLIN